LHKLGNQVIVAGRRKQALDETTAAESGRYDAFFNAFNAARADDRLGASD
jgi:short-subunit dehydrogenase involved in D-alanine esterification of teichoic acids